MPCRVMTDEEVSAMVRALTIDVLIVREHMQDPEFCVWHEHDVATIRQAIDCARREQWFEYCEISEKQGAVTSNAEEEGCLHFRHPHYYDHETRSYLPVEEK